MITRLRKVTEGHDAGFSLTELLVTMGIMSVFMAIFTTSVLQLFGASNKSDHIAQSTAQLNSAFQRIDKQMRYASAINAPNANATGSTGPWYVEFVNTSTGSDVCTQLKLDGSVLYERQWTSGSGSSATFNAVASELVPQTSTPFTFYPANGTQANQRLKTSLTSSAGDGAESGLSVTFDAMNSSQATTTNDGTTLVCQDAGGRP